MKNSNAYMADYMLRRYHQRRSEAIRRLGGKCVVCGSESELEFDHIDPAQKTFNIAKLWSASKAKIDAEVAKCQLLCHDHHLIKTANDYKKMLDHGTYWMYRKHKCRCDDCVRANTAQLREWRDRKRASVA